MTFGSVADDREFLHSMVEVRAARGGCQMSDVTIAAVSTVIRAVDGIGADGALIGGGTGTNLGEPTRGGSAARSRPLPGQHSVPAPGRTEAR
jgi:hypothetical protein